MAALLRRNLSVLVISVAAAFASRFFVLFAGRPDFVGWFNHSPYFWVQTRSLIEGNGLAYGDMPLLFALYASLAKIISMAGIQIEPAIIMASRLVMISAPALIPIPVYLLANGAAGNTRLSWPAKWLVLASGFLPLTFANMPEHLQKNMMGLLLLALSFLALFEWLRGRKVGQLALLVLLVVATCLAHLGSALAALLLIAALTFDVLLRRASLADLIRIGVLCIAVATAVSLGIRTFDPAAAERVHALLTAFIPGSLGDSLIFVVVVGTWTGLLLVIYRWFSRRTAEKSAAIVTLGRTTVLWLGLLSIPLWPGEIGIRLMLFMPLGVVVLLILFLATFPERRLVRYAAAATTLVFALMSVGEAISTLISYPDKEETSRQLALVANKYGLSRNDLVITSYGVAPIANWFLGTKGSLLTAVERDVVKLHNRVFVLNTLERHAPRLADSECRQIQSEEDRYWTTRHDIPLDGEAVPDTDFDTFAFYRLEKLPENWVFDSDGLWAGWGNCSAGAVNIPEA